MSGTSASCQCRRSLLTPIAAALLCACGNSNYLAAPGLAASLSANRSIDLSEATGPLSLDTPDAAARAAIGASLFYRSVIDVLGSESDGKSYAKSTTTEDCSGGGTRTTDKSGLDRTVRYSQCLEGSRFTDGLFKVEVTSPGYPNSGATATLGENDIPILAESRDPADDFRTLALGTLVGDVRVDSHGDVKEVNANANMKGAEEDLDGTPRMNYGLDDVRVDVHIDGSDLLINESGNFRLTGDCGVGQASVGTNRDVRINKDTGVVSDGQLQLSNASAQSASVTFNADQSVDVAVVDGAAQHYTLEQYRALCPF